MVSEAVVEELARMMAEAVARDQPRAPAAVVEFRPRTTPPNPEPDPRRKLRIA